jgi:carbon-monoxide dehydrogenase medium subunit
VIPASFDYRRAGSVEEAVEFLGSDDDAKLIAGGHSLIPMLRLRFARPSLLVDIDRLEDLRYVRRDGDRIAIGALTRHAQLARDPVLRESCPVLAETAEQIGDPQVRHRGTIGGSVAHADALGDLGTVLLTLDADVVAVGPDGERTIALADFFVGRFQSALGPREVLTELRLPATPTATYLKFTRRSHDWATVGVAAARLDGRVQVGLTAMGMTPLRATAVEEALAGGASAAEAAGRVAEGTAPSSDSSASGEYRTQLAHVLVRRALDQLPAA